MTDLLWLLLAAGGLTWFWLDSMRSREIATGIGKSLCEREGVQFLDHTVSLAKLSLHWGARGLRLRRVYQFDFSEEGLGRHHGFIVMIGMEMNGLSMDRPDPNAGLRLYQPPPPSRNGF